MAQKMVTMCPLGTSQPSAAGLWSATTNAGFSLNRRQRLSSGQSFLSLAMNAVSALSVSAEPGVGTMSSNQGAGRGRFWGSLSPRHCLTHQTHWQRAEYRTRQDGSGWEGQREIMEFCHSYWPAFLLPSINWTLYQLQSSGEWKPFHSKRRIEGTIVLLFVVVTRWFGTCLWYHPPFHIVWVVGDFEDFPVLGWAHFILCQACDWQEISATMMPLRLRPPPLQNSPSYILYRRPVRSQKLRMLSSVNGLDRLHVHHVHVWELRLRESTKSPGKRRVNFNGWTWLRNLIICLETLGWLLYVCCVFFPLSPPTLFIRIFLLQVFVAFTGKKKFEVRRRLAAKIYENWTAFQCFSPHVMLISFSKGSWLNFLFRNRRIFWIETFVIYKLGRLSALPVQQASRWDALYVELSITMCLVWFSFGWSTVEMVQWYLYFISKCSAQQFSVCDGLRLTHIVVIMPKTT